MLLFILGGTFLLGLCIFLHELGHYTFGYMVGAKAEIFSIGYGKGRWKKKIGDTTWQITAFPIGGYVKFYGQDPSDKLVPGGFYTLPPLRRIIPVLGGPFFNLILGFLILFLLHSLSGPLAPRVVLSDVDKQTTAAKLAGLRDGDIVQSIDGKKIHSFMELSQHVALSGGKKLTFLVDRKGKSIEKEVRPDVTPSGVSMIGLRVPGDRYLQVNYPTLSTLRYRLRSVLNGEQLPREIRAFPYLKNGDIILSVEGQKIQSSRDLQKILGKHHGKTVSVRVLRESYSWLAPWPKYEKTVEVPTYPEYAIHLEKVWDKKYGRPLFEEQRLYSAVEEHQRGLNYITINGKPLRSFPFIAKKFEKPRKVEINMGSKELTYSAKVHSEKIGLIGFRPSAIVHADYLASHPSFFASIRATIRDLVNNIMVYPIFFRGLFSGRISFLDNAAGPVRIFGTAGVILQSGYQNYLQLFAAISIALFVMNMLPFPVIDGGYIVLFLYEALAGKPISLRIREGLQRMGFVTLLFFGLWVMYRDFVWLIGL